jgi:hypothetical protein
MRIPVKLAFGGQGIAYSGQKEGRLVFKTGSGAYRFELAALEKRG